MAITMFVKDIPNGTSVQVLRGSAIHLAKKLINTKKATEEGSFQFDPLATGQLAGCLGVEPDEVIKFCAEMATGEVSAEEVIDRYIKTISENKSGTLGEMKTALDDLHSLNE